MMRMRVAGFLLLATGIAGVLGGTAWTVGALRGIARVESKRDEWQKPELIVRALDVGKGAVVADLGSGVGYFSLKLAPQVGPQGIVVAVDRRRLPLVLVGARALLAGCGRNVGLAHADAAAAPLPVGGVQAVLIANTYHELNDAPAVLAHAREALAPGGRIVLVDPAPDVEPPGSNAGTGHHHASAEAAALQLRRIGFEIIARDDHFIEPAGDEHDGWWLLVARKP